MKQRNVLIQNTCAWVDGDVVPAEIAIADGVIVSMQGTPEGFVPERILDGTDRLCMPGLINCHTHLYMSLFRNYADDVAFDEWLFGRILPKEDCLSPEDGYWGTLLACIEMLKSGTTTFCDMHMFPGMVPKAARQAGMRAAVSRGLTGPEGGERRISEALAERDAWREDPMVSFLLAPHAIYTCEEEYLRRIVSLAEQTGLPIHTHVSESAKEVEDCYRLHGCSPVEYLARVGILEHKTLAAHCVHVSERDMDLLAEKGVSVAHNPKSNLKLANGIAPVKQMLERGVNVCLGTDGAGSNNALNLFSEMNYACLLPKGVSGDGAAVSAKQVLHMATTGGAEALSLPKVGRLAEGWQADLVLLDLNRPSFVPRRNLTGALCYSANGSEVETVIVGGEIVVEHGKLTRIDEAEVYEQVARVTRNWN